MLTWGSPVTECEGLTLRLQDEAPGITLFPRMCAPSQFPSGVPVLEELRV